MFPIQIFFYFGAQMKAALLFVYLCFFLLLAGGDVQAASLRCHAGCMPAHTMGKLPAAVVGAIATSHDFVGDDMEEDDLNIPVARKYRWLSPCCSAMTCRRVTIDACTRTTDPPLVYGRVSYKYILQRVLRV